MIHTIGVKPAHSSILALKKELLFFDQIHILGNSAAWSLAEILIPEDSNLDMNTAVQNALQEIHNLKITGRTDNKLLEQVFTEYLDLVELGIVVSKPESEILAPTLENKKLYRKKIKTPASKADDFHNMNYLLIYLDKAIKKYDRLAPEPYKATKEKQGLDKIPIEILMNEDNLSYVEKGLILRELSCEIAARLYAFVLNHQEFARFIPILDRLSGWKSREEEDSNVSPNRLKVINAVFNSLPMPTVTTPLIEILDFRNDSEAKGHLLGLNNWIIETSTRNLTALEIQQKLEHLIFEYEKFIALNKLKFKAGRLEVAVTSIAEVAENLATLKFSKVAKTIFDLFKNDVKLLESEISAPGREIAYISSARNKFKEQV